MATTKLHGIRSTLNKSIEYIIDPRKTRNGSLVISNGCSTSGQTAQTEFENVRKQGSGRSKILAQHIIQSFAPGEITPEEAQVVGLEFCQKLLGENYQYILATHVDHEHIHNHIIVNNTNSNTHNTFETEFNQGKKSERAWAKVRELSDEICKKYCLSVIQNPENNRGKTHYEWDMSRQGLSWKAKLKFAIDNAIKESEDFEDFLRICKKRGIEVVYNPEHVIDLKFKLTGQKKFTRSRTLGWYYETKQIIKRIELYNGIIKTHAKSNLIDTQTEKMQNSSALKHWADIHNLQEVSKAINTLTEYTDKDRQSVEKQLFAAHMQKGFIANKLNSIQTEIDDLDEKIKVARKVQKLKPVMDKLKTLSGHEKKKFEKENQVKIYEYGKSVKKLLELFPSGNVPIPENMEKKRNALAEERSVKHDEYLSLKAKVSE